MLLVRIPKLILLMVPLAVVLGLPLASSPPTQTSQNSDSSHPHHNHKPKDAGQKPTSTGTPERGPGHQRMLQVLQEIAARGADEHPFMGDGRAQELTRQLADLDARSSGGTTPAYWGDDLNRWQVLLDLGIAELQLSRLEVGIEHLLGAYRLLPKIKPYAKKAQVDKTIFELGVGYMRFGETLNCALQHNAESCLLPLRGSGIHTLRDGSKNAI